VITYSQSCTRHCVGARVVQVTPVVPNCSFLRTVLCTYRSKIKAVPLPPCRLQGERKYSSYSFLTSALQLVCGQRHVLPALYSRERTHGTGQEAGWASELVWTESLQEKSFPSAGNRTPVVQSVVRQLYWVTPALYIPKWVNILSKGRESENEKWRNVKKGERMAQFFNSWCF
jgi:hypothetical protein